MQARLSAVTFNANTYFVSLIPELERAILYRIRTVALKRGKVHDARAAYERAANDNARPLPPEPPEGACGQSASGDTTDDAEAGKADAEEVREKQVGLRPITSSEVRSTLRDDVGLHAEILNAVLSDFLRAVERGVFRGPQDRALLFEIARCQTIKHVRRYARPLLLSVIATDGSAAVDHIADAKHAVADQALDRQRAMQHLRAVLDELSDDEHALLTAKFDEALTEYARARNEPAGSVRCRAKRLYDRIVRTVQRDLTSVAPTPIAA